MRHDPNGQQALFEDAAKTVFESEAPYLDARFSPDPDLENAEETIFEAETEAHSLGIMLSPEPDEFVDIGEVNPKNWKKFTDIFTDSLWIFGSRSRESVHTGNYHGNFVPQIPYQAIKRFTKPGDVVLDTFLGSGTTMIEARRLGRNGIGIELVKTVADETEDRIAKANNSHNTWQMVIQGDSTSEETISQVRQYLAEQERTQVQLLIMHPPYHDIVKFSDDSRDLCNAHTLTDFLESFKKVVHRTYDLLEPNRFLVVVIGDKYSNSEWVPLGFRTMEAVQSVGYTLKSIVVKNMEGNRAKRNLQNFWRQRAFRGNYYIFKHEYIFFFQKTGKIDEHFKRLTEFVTEIDKREELNLIRYSSLARGEALNELLIGNIWLLPSRILILQQTQLIKAVVIDLTDVKITEEVKDEIKDFIGNKPGSIVDVAILAESDKRETLKEIFGIAQVYSPDEYSLELLAHALYNIRKSIGAEQRAGREAGVAFATKFNQALEKQFEQSLDYEWRQHGASGIGFKFFKKDPTKPFNSTKNGFENFRIGIDTKWVSKHESEKAPQIRNNYYNKGFELIAVVGHNTERWKTAIQKRGNFADYYLFLNKEDEKLLDQLIITRPLMKVDENGELKEIGQTIVDLLRSRQADF